MRGAVCKMTGRLNHAASLILHYFGNKTVTDDHRPANGPDVSFNCALDQKLAGPFSWTSWSGKIPEFSRFPPILWFFNAGHEPVNFYAALDPEQQFFALRSLSVIMKPSPERDQLGAKMAQHLAEELTDILPNDIALVGGNCQGAPYAISFAQRLLELGHDIKSVAAIDAMPDRAIAVPALLNFGEGAPERNPFLNDFALTSKRVKNLFPAYRQARLPCGHAQYFEAENLPYLLANIENFIGTRIRAAAHQ